MPELPEVETSRAFVEGHCVNRTVQDAIVADDDKVIVGIGNKELEAALKGKKLVGACRKGKHMWLDFDSGPALMLHFGMTGSIAIRGQESVKYVMTKVSDIDVWPPRFWKIQLNFSGGVQMAFCDPRRFARVRVQADPEKHEPVSSLGFDVLAGVPSVEELTVLLAKKRASIKSILLDQSFSAGVGNWVADEVCHWARIHPEQKGFDLNQEQLTALREALIEVPRIAVDVEADSSRFPDDWIFHYRWNENGAPKRYSFLKIGGRTTAIETKLQKLLPVSRAPAKARGAAKRAKPADTAGSDDGEPEDVKTEPKSAPKRKRAVKKELVDTPQESGDVEVPMPAMKKIMVKKEIAKVPIKVLVSEVIEVKAVLIPIVVAPVERRTGRNRS